MTVHGDSAAIAGAGDGPAQAAATGSPGAHAFVPGRWAVAQKLWLGFGLLLVTMVVGGTVLLYQILQIDRNLRQVVEIEEPLEEAILEMEINAGKTARAVLEYVRDLGTKHLEAMRDSEADFERYAARFERLAAIRGERLAETRGERQLGQEAAEIYGKFKALGYEIVALADRRHSAMETFRRDVREIDELIDETIQKTIDRATFDSIAKFEAALDMEIKIDETIAAIEGYVLRPNPALRQAAADAESDFERFAALYRKTGLSAEEKDRLDAIGRGFAKAVTAGGRIVTVTDKLNTSLDEFEQYLETMDAILGDRIQPLIRARTAAASDYAQASIDWTVMYSLVLALAGLCITSILAWALTQRIIGPIQLLVHGTEIIGDGNLDHRIDAAGEDEFSHLAAAFNRMVENLGHARMELDLKAHELARSNAELEHFASVASHDLQEPLRKVRAFSDRLKSKYANVLDEQGRDYVDRMQYATERMQALIESLLHLSRVSTTGKAFAPVDLNLIARDTVSDLEVLIQESGAKVEFSHLPTVDADPTQIRQLLQNLIGNALKYRRSDVPPRIQVSAEIAGNGATAFNGRSAKLCRVRFADNGIGFDPRYSERIFGIFQRLHGRGEYEGTGMGLAICRKIAEHHGGKITAEGRLGEGAAFTVTLPIARTSREHD